MIRKPVVRAKSAQPTVHNDRDEHRSAQPTPSARDKEQKEQCADAPTQSAPAAGPHATKPLTNPESTPGAGTLPDGATDDVEAGTG